MKSFLEYITEEDLDEALNRSLARVHTHVQNRPIGIMTGNREENTAEQNKAAKKDLVQNLKKHGFGYAHVRGVGQEDGGAVSEPSILIIGNKGDSKGHLEKFLIKHGQKYGQSGVLYKPHDDENAHFIDTKENIGQKSSLGKFHANDSAAKFFTKLKGNRQLSFSEETRVAYLSPVTFTNRTETLF